MRGFFFYMEEVLVEHKEGFSQRKGNITSTAMQLACNPNLFGFVFSNAV